MTEKHTDRISIIIPVYNTEKYLSRCFDSIILQTYKDIEIIIINDGSTDNSLSIIRDYEKKDNRIIVIDKENEGVSSARNMGIEQATGEYIMFCDSDDSVHPQWCEYMLEQIKRYPADLISCRYLMVADMEMISSQGIDCRDSEPATYYDLFLLGTSGSVWNKIYRISVIQDNSIRFRSGLPIGEDVHFNIEYAKYIDNYRLVSDDLYYYTDNPDSAKHKWHKEWLEWCLDLFYIRVPLIDSKKISEFCDGWLYMLLVALENIHDTKNGMSWLQRMQYNQAMVKTEAFQYCLHNATGEKENKYLLRMLKLKSYYCYWFLQKVSEHLHRLRRTH